MNIKNKDRFKTKKVLVNILFVGIVILVGILLQILLSYFDLKDENIFLLYTLAIIIIIIKTKNIIYGVVSSFIYVLSFNFFNADPKYTLAIADPNYYISFLIFIVVSIVVGYLMLVIQKKESQAKNNQNKVEAMYNLSSELIDNHDRNFLLDFVIEFFKDYMDYDFSIIDTDGKVYGSEIDDKYVHDMLRYSLAKNMAVGKGTFDFSESNYLVLPIRSIDNEYGALYVNLCNIEINDSEVEFIKKNLLHLVVALDREAAMILEESSRLAVEKEKFKISILRSLSHDLKTPLTSIKSGSDLILSSYDSLDDESKKSIIGDIYNEACDLNTFIVNLLNMSKLDRGKKLVNRKKEPVDEILQGVYQKVKKNLVGRRLVINQSDDLVFVYTDPILLDMVLYNLIDNAIKHTKEGTTIHIDYSFDDEGVWFKVSDDGGGIEVSSFDKIFEDFYSLALNQDRKRSTGLGLSICRAIVEAHGGKISVFNNDLGGATFSFNIPNEEGNDD